MVLYRNLSTYCISFADEAFDFVAVAFQYLLFSVSIVLWYILKEPTKTSIISV